MKGALVLAIAVLLLPGSVIMLLSANFGALKGYLIGGLAFFSFVFFLSLIWTFGLPGTPSLTGPKGTDPSFKQFELSSPVASKYPGVRQFQGREGGGWLPEPAEPEGGGKLPPDQEKLRSDLETARQGIIQELITKTNKTVKDSSRELDVTNLDAKVFYNNQGGTELAAVVISPKEPPRGSGLLKPSFRPKTFFAYRDPGAPFLPSLLIMGISLVLLLAHIIGLGVVESRRPLGVTPRTGEAATRAPSRV